MTIITNAKKEAILPPAGDLKAGVENKNHFYSLNGTTHTSPELIFAIFPFRCLCQAIMSCRYGSNRIGPIGVKRIIVEQHVLMCMRGMLKIT